MASSRVIGRLLAGRNSQPLVIRIELLRHGYLGQPWLILPGKVQRPLFWGDRRKINYSRGGTERLPSLILLSNMKGQIEMPQDRA